MDCLQGIGQIGEVSGGTDILWKGVGQSVGVMLGSGPENSPESAAVEANLAEVARGRVLWYDRAGVEHLPPVGLVFFQRAAQAVELGMHKLRPAELVQRRYRRNRKHLSDLKGLPDPFDSFKPDALDVPCVVADGQEEDNPVGAFRSPCLLPKHVSNDGHFFSFGSKGLEA